MLTVSRQCKFDFSLVINFPINYRWQKYCCVKYALSLHHYGTWWRHGMETVWITCPLWGESTGHQWTPPPHNNAELRCCCCLPCLSDVFHNQPSSLQWRHNERDGVPDHQPHECLQVKENIKAPRHWPLCGTFTSDRWTPTQRASSTENVSIWWRHHFKIHNLFFYQFLSTILYE